MRSNHFWHCLGFAYENKGEQRELTERTRQSMVSEQDKRVRRILTMGWQGDSGLRCQDEPHYVAPTEMFFLDIANALV